MAEGNRVASTSWVGLLVILSLASADAHIVPIVVHTAGNQQFASPGTSGFSNPADLSVLITTNTAFRVWRSERPLMFPRSLACSCDLA
jgi:hypothetical protein